MQIINIFTIYITEKIYVLFIYYYSVGNQDYFEVQPFS